MCIQRNAMKFSFAEGGVAWKRQRNARFLVTLGVIADGGGVQCCILVSPPVPGPSETLKYNRATFCSDIAGDEWLLLGGFLSFLEFLFFFFFSKKHWGLLVEVENFRLIFYVWWRVASVDIRSYRDFCFRYGYVEPRTESQPLDVALVSREWDVFQSV